MDLDEIQKEISRKQDELIKIRKTYTPIINQYLKVYYNKRLRTILKYDYANHQNPSDVNLDEILTSQPSKLPSDIDDILKRIEDEKEWHLEKIKLLEMLARRKSNAIANIIDQI